MKSGFLNQKFDLDLKKPDGAKLVSYSQFSNYQKCQLYWKLCYIDRLKPFEPSIHTCFGTTMHSIIQEWITVMFTQTIKKSNELDFKKMLLDELKKNYAADVEKSGKHFSTKEQLSEFYLDGLEILEWFRKKRTKYFSSKDEELIGIEVPLMICPDETKPNVFLTGYLDAVIRNKKNKRIRILDFKTSGRGWSDWEKRDETKIAQLLLYKIYFSKQYNVPISDIEVEYIILKRKIDPDSQWAQRRVQVFSPSQGNVSYNKVSRNFQVFLDACFLPDGSYNMLNSFRPISGKDGKNCRFCEFKNNYAVCPPENRLSS